MFYELGTPELLAAARVRWSSAPLQGRTLLLSGMYASEIDVAGGESEGDDFKNGSDAREHRVPVAPYALVEVRRSGLEGYGPGIEPSWAPEQNDSKD